ncbi:MAG TPA: hypothetical protein VGU20_00290 [Stellaceae bacterium]|nr:hypothetical protein [Stellaceae bacterium]
MATFDTFAKRKRARERVGQSDVYQYDIVPPFLRKQIMMVIAASLGPWTEADFPHHYLSGNENWNLLAGILEREFETFPAGEYSNDKERCVEFLGSAELDGWLSAVEVACRMLSHMAAHGARNQREACGATQDADDALAEINDRFRENAFGYEFRNGEIIRIDDQYVHAQVVRPALALLAEPGFEKANEEFMTAHRHYREGKAKDAVVAANRAFESTLKAICIPTLGIPEGGSRQ